MTNKFVMNDFAIDLNWCGVAGIAPVSALELLVAMLAQWTIEREHIYVYRYIRTFEHLGNYWRCWLSQW